MRTLILLCIFSSLSLFAQSEEDTTETKKFGIFGYPYAFYSPETELAFGVGGMAYFRLADVPDIELSNIILSGYYTINNQYKITLTPELYLNAKGDFLTSDIYFGEFLDKFYGFGGESEEIDDPDYLTKDFGIYINYQKNFTANIEAGIIYDYLNSSISDKKTNPFLADDNLLGSEGGVSSGLGISLAWDSRDFAYVATRGWYYYASATFYSEALGSTFDFNEYLFDFREYYRLGSAKHMFAFQGYGKFTRGNPPFYEVPRLGGGTTMRGYFEGRYRDNNYLTVQMEYKAVLFWRIGGVLFAGMGDVAGEFKYFKLVNAKYSYGFGFRYIFDKEERLTIRADFGFGNNTSGVYFSMQETF